MKEQRRSEIQFINRKNDIENCGMLRKIRDKREEILSLKVSQSTRITECSINGFSYSIARLTIS
jgi:hypothetical protein